MQKPSFKEWFDSRFNVVCDVTVKCKDGTFQNIFECTFGYGFRGNELITKKGYKIEDYFFVDHVVDVFNFTEVL